MTKADEYLNTIARIEPDITPIDFTRAAASIAISLKRIADSLEEGVRFLYDAFPNVGKE